jgi:hypothetical protein
MKKYVFILFVIFSLTGCQDVFYPEVEDMPPSLVVDGMLCTNPAKSRVLLSYTSTYSESSYNPAAPGYTVYTIDDKGERIDFIENGTSGIYLVQNDLAHAAKIGTTYTLYIESSGGDIFQSTPQLANECAKISNFYLKAETETVLTEDSYGDVLEIKSDGAGFYNDTKGILPEDNYFIYKWIGYEEHHSIIGTPSNPPSDIFRHVPIMSTYVNVICPANADEAFNKYLKQNKFVFIPKYTFKNYSPPVPAGISVFKDNFDGYIFASDQYSISKDAYRYWKDCQDQLTASGKIFDKVSSQIRGNLTCTSNPDKNVFGVFYATDIKTRYDYLMINSKNKVSYRQLDTLPELWIDTCSWSLPKGYIISPI